AIDFIFQCSEGIPRQINNLCDNAMLAGYAAGEQIISRAVIEEVADNLDLLPRRDQLISGEQKIENINSARVLTPEAREELWNQKSRVEPSAKPKMFQTEAKAVNGTNGAATNGNRNGNGNGDGKYKPFGDLDDEINLEIGDTGAFH
ncbi:MAG TPA: hypothetical protein VF599_11965, partial [Pyrinomonadaceae bacterium]